MICFIFKGKNLETGLQSVLTYKRELDGNDEDPCEIHLKEASKYARGKS